MGASPKEIAVDFENVGGQQLHGAFACARNQARFAICVMIEDYNSGSNHACRYIMRMIAARIRMQGFLYFDFLSDMPDFYRDMGGWIASGKVKSRETVREGIEEAPQAILDLFSGANMGKILVKL